MVAYDLAKCILFVHSWLSPCTLVLTHVTFHSMLPCNSTNQSRSNVVTSSCVITEPVPPRRNYS